MNDGTIYGPTHLEWEHDCPKCGGRLASVERFQPDETPPYWEPLFIITCVMCRTTWYAGYDDAHSEQWSGMMDDDTFYRIHPGELGPESNHDGE